MSKMLINHLLFHYQPPTHKCCPDTYVEYSQLLTFYSVLSSLFACSIQLKLLGAKRVVRIGGSLINILGAPPLRILNICCVCVISVGDLEFWSEQKKSSDSILGKLVEYCKQQDAMTCDSRLRKSKKRMQAWMTPHWDLVKHCTFKPNMTSKFHHSVKELQQSEKNIAFNTLIKVAQPSGKDLANLPRPDTDKPLWQMTALKGCDNILQIGVCSLGLQSRMFRENCIADPALVRLS